MSSEPPRTGPASRPAPAGGGRDPSGPERSGLTRGHPGGEPDGANPPPFDGAQPPVETRFPYPVSDVYNPEALDSERGPVYVYRYSGTRELEGVVNWWLYAVIAGLTAWAVFYTLAYWGGPGPGLDYTVPM